MREEDEEDDEEEEEKKEEGHDRTQSPGKKGCRPRRTPPSAVASRDQSVSDLSAQKDIQIDDLSIAARCDNPDRKRMGHVRYDAGKTATSSNVWNAAERIFVAFDEEAS